MIAEVMVDIAHSDVDKKFDYSFNGGNIFVGSRVTVPFGNRKISGVVTAIKEQTNLPIDKVKEIVESLDEIPAINPESFNLIRYIEKRFHVSKALAFRLFLPSEMRRGSVAEKIVKRAYVVNFDRDNVLSSLSKLAKKQALAYDFLLKNDGYNVAELNNQFGNSAINGLLSKQVICFKEEHLDRSPYSNLNAEDKKVILTSAQENAVKSVENTNKMVTLLHGVTGSGKTEVYLKLIKQTLSKGKTAIMLVPEIALTPQMLRQLRARYGNLAAIIHSGLSAGEKFDEWWRIRMGEAKIVIGARSAIFSPIENVGLIIIDEEHDSSYRSEKVPRYDTIEIAKERAKYNNAKIVLGSATPLIESYRLATTGEYNLAVLSERVNKKPMPEIIIADMRKEIRRGNNTEFSSALKDELKECLASGNQAMIFLNRRGYSQYVICTECGHVPKCKDCDVSLTYHYDDDSLKCHYCGAKYHMVTQCPECGSKYLRYGVSGTQKVELELQKLFPNARVLRMDNDTTSTKDGHFKILTQFSEHKADILVGTQMIAKGHDFPGVTLVGILDADMSLHFSDYRSGERTFQLITQVAGRSGRAEQKGKVVLQTYSPTNYVLGFATNYDYFGFYEREISVRKATRFPPFASVVRVLVSSEDDALALNAIKYVYEDLKDLRDKNSEHFIFMNCMKAPIKRIQNKFRYQVLMRLNAGAEHIIDEIYKTVQKYNDLKVFVSVEENPSNMS